MPLTTGVHHIASVTSDLDRLIEFYESVFDAVVLADLDEHGLRHAFIDIGADTVLHPFAVRDDHAPSPTPMFERGHLDHVALKVDDVGTFERVRDRLVACGASDGTVTDFGRVRTVTFRDPDGWEGEVAHWADGDLRTFDERGEEPYRRP